MAEEKKRSRKKLVKHGAVLFAIALAGALLVYFFADEIFKYRPQPNEWVHSSGLVISFRANLADANTVPVKQEDCNSINTAFNIISTENVTIYAKNDSQDFALHNVEITQIAINLINYYRAIERDVTVKSSIWSLEDPPLGSGTHPRIYLIGPSSAQNTSVSFSERVVFVSGTSVSEMDKATTRAMMCMFGIKV